MRYTSIQILGATRVKLQKLKAYKRETYDEVLNKLIALIPNRDLGGEFSDNYRAKTLARMAEYKQTPAEHRREVG